MEAFFQELHDRNWNKLHYFRSYILRLTDGLTDLLTTRWQCSYWYYIPVATKSTGGNWHVSVNSSVLIYTLCLELLIYLISQEALNSHYIYVTFFSTSYIFSIFAEVRPGLFATIKWKNKRLSIQILRSSVVGLLSLASGEAFWNLSVWSQT